MIDFWGPIIEAVAKALPWALGIIAALGLGMARYRSGKREARMETALEAAERYAKTRKAMDDEESAMGDDPDAARRWLRERGQQ